MRRILQADRDGKYVAIDNPGAVVVDHGTMMIRVGLDRWPISRPPLWRFITFMLINANSFHRHSVIGEALGLPNAASSTLSKYASSSEALLTELEMVLETAYGAGGYRLHTDPRETLECCRNLAPGQPLPWRLTSTPAGRGTPRTKCARSRPPSTTYLGR